MPEIPRTTTRLTDGREDVHDGNGRETLTVFRVTIHSVGPVHGFEPGVAVQISGIYTATDDVAAVEIDAATDEWTADNMTLTDGAWTASMRFWSAGTHTLMVTGRSDRGSGFAQHDIQVTLDHAAPQFDILSPDEGRQVPLPESGLNVPVGLHTTADNGDRFYDVGFDGNWEITNRPAGG